MPVTLRRWTRDEVLALPDDGNRYELIDGELLVTPSPRGRHQRAAWAMYDRIAPYVRAQRLGVTGLSPAELDLKSGQVSQPDLFVAPRTADGKEPVEWPEFGIPILVVEILSPSTARYDRITKRRGYQRSGVPEYWIVDLDARLVERWRPEDDRPELVDVVFQWRPEGVTAILDIDLAAYFREVWAEDPA